MANSFVHVHLVALRYFSETVRAGSMRQASEKLSVAASAINRQIMKLEDQLQCKLFERHHEGVRLTSAGEVLYNYVSRLDRDLERAIAQIDDLRGLRRGHVRLASEDGIARDFLPDILAAYHEAHPGVTFSVEILSATEILDGVAADAFDIGVSMSPPVATNVWIAGRAEMPIGVISAPGRPIALRKTLSLDDIADERIIRAKEGTGGITGFNAHLNENAPYSGLVETNAPDFITNLVKVGLGVGFRTPIGIMNDIAQGAIAFIPLIDRRARNPSLTLFVRPQRNLAPPGAVLLERMRAALPEFSDRVWSSIGLTPPEAGRSADKGAGETGVARMATSG